MRTWLLPGGVGVLLFTRVTDHHPLVCKLRLIFHGNKSDGQSTSKPLGPGGSTDQVDALVAAFISRRGGTGGDGGGRWVVARGGCTRRSHAQSLP